ncbi:sulfatase [Zhouia spongiae]|uniref:Sulfatase n=1 Tax=Zhouia spongiae TaxID=2202721 RepID=A0ABY3YR98_9FLAO|nr:sulfatase [Zhouia spongiae]UNZ00373.1 sulfatase [Zhouia spongiae]
MKKTAAFITCLFIILNLLSCNSQHEELITPPNIVWITSEDNSKHYMKLFDEHGVNTPNIERLASGGLTFNNAFSNAPVCSVARSTIISGCYAPATGSQFHRRMEQVPLPEGLEMFPAYLKAGGYYTSNNNKEDYNFIKSDSVWDDSSKKATWKNRQANQPFFHVQNIANTHEGSLHFRKRKSTVTDPDSVFVFPNHPQTDLFKYTNARYRDHIIKLDTLVGNVIHQLEKDGLLENTFVFYFGDHGGVLPGSKGYLYETGLHVPLVVYVPEKYKHLVPAERGTRIDGFINFIDLAPTVLHLAGADIPEQIDGTPFLGKDIKLSEINSRDEAFAYADRFDEKYDLVRSLRKGKYKYIRSYQPFNYDGLYNEYRYRQPGYRQWKDGFEADTLNDIQAAFFKTRPTELLFDIENDPYETTNLADNPEYQKVLLSLRSRLKEWIINLPDLSFYPEFHLKGVAFDNPAGFGTQHKNNISSYVEIADLSLKDFSTVGSTLEKALHSSDPWQRYWALISCSIFGKEALPLKPAIATIMQNDSLPINKVRAAEFMGITKTEDPSAVMTQALYNCPDPVEALLILNSIALMHDAPYNFKFKINKDLINPAVVKDQEVNRRLKYLL